MATLGACFPYHLVSLDRRDPMKGYWTLANSGAEGTMGRDNSLSLEASRSLHRSEEAQFDTGAAIGPNTTEGFGNEVVGGTDRESDWRQWLAVLKRLLVTYTDQEWYVFVKPETYLFWSTLLPWLNVHDSAQKLYIGERALNRSSVLAEAGPVTVYSRAALQALVEVFQWEDPLEPSNIEEILQAAIAKAGVQSVTMAPMSLHVDQAPVDYGRMVRGTRMWCHAAAFYHPMSAHEITEIWRFEQTWLAETNDTIRHSDVYTFFLLPQLLETRGRKTDWDNHSSRFGRSKFAKSFRDCRELCELDLKCVQFAHEDQRCTLSTMAMLGEPHEVIQSGWMVDRVAALPQNLGKCDGRKEQLWLSG